MQEAPSQASAEAQIPFINTLVSQKVGVIAIAGNDANAVAPALKRAAQQGVKVSPTTPTSRPRRANCSSTKRRATVWPR